MDKNDELDFDALLEASENKGADIAVGDRVEARIIRVGKSYLFLDLGARAEGLLSREEALLDDGELTVKVGDRVQVFVTAFRDGAVLCGRTVGGKSAEIKPDDREATLAALKEAFDSGIPVEGTVKESQKGGFSVRIMGLRAFCPISQIDKVYCEDETQHIGQTYRFEILKLEEGGRNLVISRRNVLEREAAELAKKAWAELEVGGTYKGTVTAVKPYGAFVDIGGVEGLVHISEIGYDQVTDPGDVLTKGQEVTVAVVEMDLEKGRISLSLKALMADPWDDVSDTIKPNQVIAGRVTRTAKFGAFVELAGGIEGLVHISNLVANRRVKSPLEVVAVGQEVTVRVLAVDQTERRISLTMILEQEEEDWTSALAQSKQSAKKSMGTLGDLMKLKK
jgi:small subunit ribosomal protein S1